jgi:hypothetical protein
MPESLGFGNCPSIIPNSSSGHCSSNLVSSAIVFFSMRASTMSDGKEGQNSFHKKLTEQLIRVFDGAAETRRHYYETNPDKRRSTTDIGSTITKHSYMNAAIAGALSFIPGPWRLLAVVPISVKPTSKGVRHWCLVGV